MVGGVAHEINNPLMGMMNYVEYARDKSPGTG
ncbi:MAG: histidine kinase dimerization/phospho-acceptor domain-containing protein [Sideroxyarcus sp.]